MQPADEYVKIPILGNTQVFWHKIVADVEVRLMETVYITTGFAWKPEDRVETKRVELLISKAEDIYQDYFDSQELLVESGKYSTYILEQWNSDGGSYCVCPSLEPGVYQFVFRVDNGKEKELKISDYYERTFLGNGRAVNYIELTEYSKVDQSANDKRKISRSQGGSSAITSTSSKKRHSARETSLNSSDSQHAPECRSCTIL